MYVLFQLSARLCKDLGASFPKTELAIKFSQRLKGVGSLSCIFLNILQPFRRVLQSRKWRESRNFEWTSHLELTFIIDIVKNGLLTQSSSSLLLEDFLGMFLVGCQQLNMQLKIASIPISVVLEIETCDLRSKH